MCSFPYLQSLGAHRVSIFSSVFSRRVTRLRLRRIITSNRFIPELDGFRFLAIFIVIISHIYVQCHDVPTSGPILRPIFELFRFGIRGVFLFFTISGFILALPFARHHLQGGSAIDLRSYFKRRVTRLEPPYVLAMFSRIPLLLIFKHPALAALGSHLAASLLYIHTIVFGVSSTINPVAWSLEVEIQFYLLAPFLTTIFMVRNKSMRRAIIVTCILLSGVLSTRFIGETSSLSPTLLNFAQYFLAGFLLCDFYLTGDRLKISPWLYDALAVVGLLWTLLTTNPWHPVIVPFVTVLIYMAGFHGRILNLFFSSRPISLIGGMSYSIYLTHTTILTGMQYLLAHLARHLASLNPFLELIFIMALCSSAVFTVGILFFILIERPCMDPSWPHKIAMRFRQDQSKVFLSPVPR